MPFNITFNQVSRNKTLEVKKNGSFWCFSEGVKFDEICQWQNRFADKSIGTAEEKTYLKIKMVVFSVSHIRRGKSMKLANDKIGLARCLQEVIYRKLSTVRPPLPFFGRRTFFVSHAIFFLNWLLLRILHLCGSKLKPNSFHNCV